MSQPHKSRDGGRQEERGGRNVCLPHSGVEPPLGALKGMTESHLMSVLLVLGIGQLS